MTFSIGSLSFFITIRWLIASHLIIRKSPFILIAYVSVLYRGGNVIFVTLYVCQDM